MAREVPERPHPDAPLTLITLGGARLVAPGGEELLGPGKALAFLIYLAASPGRSATREHLLDLLWADLPPDKARHALRQQVWHLRQILGPDAIHSPNGQIELALPVTLDRDQLTEAAHAGDLESAVRLYRGEFLAGFAAPGSADFEHWADVERARCRGIFLRAAETLVRRWLDAGHFREAQQLARRARDAARLSESAWRLLLECHIAAGDQASFALEQAALESLLSSENREPEPATRTLLTRQQQEQSEGAARGLVAELVGREREFATIITAWEQARRGIARHLHISAPAGLGKSRLLDDVRRRLRSTGARVVSLRAHPADRAIPMWYAGEIAQALAELPGAAAISPASAAALVALHPALSARYSSTPDPATGAELVRRRGGAIAELLAAVADEQPLALLLDDLHWADPTSRQILEPILGRLEGRRILAVTAARPVAGIPHPADPHDLLQLPPLGTTEVRALLASLATLPDAPWATLLPDRLVQASAGSPLLVLESLQLALDGGLLALRDNCWRSDDPDRLFATLAAGQALRHRVTGVPPEPGRILLSLALAGTPLTPDELARATHRGSDGVRAGLIVLEHRGLAERVGDAWLPAHDEIAALALDLGAPALTTELEGGLGTMLLENAGAARERLAQAGRHLVAGERWREARSAFIRYVRSCRDEGDARRVRFLAREFVAADQTETESVNRILATMGRWNRLRYTSARRPIVVGFATLAATAVITAWFFRQPEPDITLLLRVERAGGRDTLFAIDLRRDDWVAGRPIDATRARQASLPLAEDGLRWFLENPGKRKLWAAQVATGTPNTDDLWLVSEGHRVRPLVQRPRDDGVSRWSPDGSHLAIVTASHSPKGADDYDIELVTLEGSTHAVTIGPDHDSEPRFSPDGSRLAFKRTSRTTGETRVCLASFDGRSTPWCVPHSDGTRVLTLVDWAGAHGLLILVQQVEEGGSVFRVDLRSGQWSRMLPDVFFVASSPDGRWLVYRVLEEGSGYLKWRVAPTDDPNQSRPLDFGDRQDLDFLIAWTAPREMPPWLESIRVRDTGTVLPLAIGTRISADLLGSDGRPLESAPPLRWESEDTSVARIESTGLVIPVRPGYVTVSVTAGGWRSARRSFRVAADTARTAFLERWEQGLTHRWVAFGEPRPEIVTDRDGHRAFWNRGDGSYPSGAYLRQPLDGRRGFGVELELATPISAPQWQVANIELLGGLDSLAYQGWDHAYADGLVHDDSRSCYAAYPGTEGAESARSLRYSVGVSQGMVDLQNPVGLASGRPWRLRLQIFPDGTCGIAVNGVPIRRSRAALLLDKPFGIRLGAQSAGTRILHRSVDVWQGVKTDVPWYQLERRDTTSLNPPRP